MDFLVLFEILRALKRLLAYLVRSEHKSNGERKIKKIKSNLTDMRLQRSVNYEGYQINTDS
jgi:hypothetical protein